MTFAEETRNVTAGSGIGFEVGFVRKLSHPHVELNVPSGVAGFDALAVTWDQGGPEANRVPARLVIAIGVAIDLFLLMRLRNGTFTDWQT